MTEKPNPFAALLDGVPRWSMIEGTQRTFMARTTGGEYLHVSEVLAALAAAVPADLAEAGKVLEGVTPGPWQAVAAGQADDLNEVVVFKPEFQSIADAEGANARFIAWCREGVPALLARIAAQEAQIKGMTKERDELATANHRQASCIHVTAANLGPDCSATVDGLPKAARHVAAERDALLGAVKGLVEVLDQHETKGPLPDTALMFCWLAAQNVRAVLRGYMLEKPE